MGGAGNPKLRLDGVLDLPGPIDILHQRRVGVQGTLEPDPVDLIESARNIIADIGAAEIHDQPAMLLL